MVKLLLCLFGAAVLAACVLQLRQQRLELSYQTAHLHEQIADQQAKLWDQQLRIAGFTGPNAISNTVKAHNLQMVPQSPVTRPAAIPASARQAGRARH